jgi:hypothetical protein
MSLQGAATDNSLVGSNDAAIRHSPEECGVEQQANYAFRPDAVDMEKTRRLVQCQSQPRQFHELRGELRCGDGTFAVTLHENLHGLTITEATFGPRLRHPH